MIEEKTLPNLAAEDEVSIVRLGQPSIAAPINPKCYLLLRVNVRKYLLDKKVGN